MITSASNRQLKNVKRLLTSSSERKKQNLFVIEGERLFKETPKSQIEAVYVAARASFLAADLKDCEVVEDSIFDRLSDTVSPQGIMALVRIPKTSLEDIISKKAGNSEKGLYLLLDDIRDPGNLGTILRTAEAAGVDGIFMSEGCADIYSPKVVRSTMGSIFRTRFCTVDLDWAIGHLKEAGCTVYGACLEGSSEYDKIKYALKSAFIIGNEANGISPGILSLADARVKIPMKGKVESLNAAVSAAVLLFNPRLRK